jgi:hypothetical protein
MARNFPSGQPHESPDAPHPAGAVPATGTVGASVTLTVIQAGITPAPPCVPQAFRQPCEHCGHEMVWAFDPVLSAKLDWLAVLVDDPEPTDDEEGQP